MANILNSHHILKNSQIAFGTSGARGLVSDFTNNVCGAFTHAFIDVIKPEFRFDTIAIAIDNRPSSHSMAMACAKAAQQANIKVIYYGVVPTPALAYVSMQLNLPCIMVTGSHIPFDRNGLKFYRPDGEITKQDEVGILNAQIEFEAITNTTEIEVNPDALNQYISRYTSLFANQPLLGKRIGIYEHSSAGRDCYHTIFNQLGADVIRLERSDVFVPIDTEAVAEEDRVKARNWTQQYQLDALFSTDGDGDRPLLADEHGEWLRGDILGLLCAQALNIEALAVPVSCNTAIELTQSFKQVIRTKIGSPYVIAAFDTLKNQYRSFAGFEANGGFLLGSDIAVGDKVLKSLPTRDAVLPAIIALTASMTEPLSKSVNALPKRITASDRIKNFATECSKAIIANAAKAPQQFVLALGYTQKIISNINQTDGLRITFNDGDIIHLRPSGNAPELRCYAESDVEQQALDYVSNTLLKVQTI
ncbi:phosphomannomutase [Shewanella saliphila]|uniref:Phosphomannomutase n=1 Tax=Shewanella saliphila TaxID=2282698 RepID=A0ABQ2Q285_9GAMM|nr:phosphomannomutase [Shewanella saliphila]MCL1101359.1 phosphomannomutase [Shewanella saliphila]GGP39842.1 phosphomannomutase [Shewanella saliphila]